MPRRWRILSLAFACVGVLLWPLSDIASASPTEATFIGTSIRSMYVRPPRGGSLPGKPLQVLVALHGMGNNGEDFSRDLTEYADRFGWLIIAPTISYGDWKNPDQVAREEPLLIAAISDYLDRLPQSTGLSVRKQVLVLGHSRGAQLAHRFAEFRPDRVLAVAALSAGTYTLPVSSGPQGGMKFPFGLNDIVAYAGRSFDTTRFQGIQFWVGVGGQDNNPADLPRQWDSIEGTTRLQRAQAFEAAMVKLGATSVLRVFGDAKHEVTGEMRSAACMFLGRAMQPREVFGSPLASSPISI